MPTHAISVVFGIGGFSEFGEYLHNLHNNAIGNLPQTTSRNASTANAIDINSANISSVDLRPPPDADNRRYSMDANYRARIKFYTNVFNNHRCCGKLITDIPSDGLQNYSFV